MPAEVLSHSRRIMPSGPITAASLLRLYPGLWASLAYDWPHTPTDSHRVATLSLLMRRQSYCRVFSLPFFNMFKGPPPSSESFSLLDPSAVI